MKRTICLILLSMLAATAVLADIARPDRSPSRTPKPRKQIDTMMSIRLESSAKDARLIIPASQIKQLRAQLEQLDNDSDDTAALSTPNSFSRTQTVVSGMFLSLAFVFGGMWFVRSGTAMTRTGKSLIALAVTLGVASAATLVYANVGPPPTARSITGKMFSQEMHAFGGGWGNIKLEISNSDQVELIVPNPRPAATVSGSTPSN
ncbi:MAG: hypothetical protein ABIV21_02790 [Pyrinomonadaceae bacterium]